METQKKQLIMPAIMLRHAATRWVSPLFRVCTIDLQKLWLHFIHMSILPLLILQLKGGLELTQHFCFCPSNAAVSQQ